MNKTEIAKAAKSALAIYGTPKYFNAYGECNLRCPAGHTFTVYRAVNWSSDKRITQALVIEALTAHSADMDETPCM